MMKRIFFFFFVIFCVHWSIEAKIIYVTLQGNDTNNGYSWATAKQSIYGASTVAEVGDSVFVAVGQYGYCATKSGVHYFGGFIGSESSSSERLPMEYGILENGFSTIIFTESGSALGAVYEVDRLVTIDGFNIMGTGPVGAVSTTDPVAAAYLNGRFVMRNCRISGKQCGIWMRNNKSYIENVLVENCDKGIYVSSGGSDTLDNCVIRHCQYAIDANRSICINNCKIVDNSFEASHYNDYSGLAPIHSRDGTLKINNCIITGNSAVEQGANYSVSGAIYAEYYCDITNTLIANNSASSLYTDAVAAIYYSFSKVGDMQNSTIANNHASVGNASSMAYTCKLRKHRYYNNIFANNTVGDERRTVLSYTATGSVFSYNAVEGDALPGLGNIVIGEDDVVFDMSDSAWTLAPNSVCLDAGYPYPSLLPYALQTDLAGRPRLSGAAMDMGAYELPQPNQAQAIVWEQELRVPISESYFPLTATASSGLPVSYASSDTNVALVEADGVVVRGMGYSYITASQSGNDIYTAAAPITRLLLITPIEVYDTIQVEDTTHIVNYDTLMVLDTTVVYDTIAIADTIRTYETVYINDTLWTYDTVVVQDTMMVYDTIAIADTIRTYETVYVNDTLWTYDTVVVYDTAWIYDTVVVYDTVQVSIGEVEDGNALWSIGSEGDCIMVRGAEGETVQIFDAVGRRMYVRTRVSEAVRFQMPAAGVYLVRVGNSPARRVAVVR